MTNGVRNANSIFYVYHLPLTAPEQTKNEDNDDEIVKSAKTRIERATATLALLRRADELEDEVAKLHGKKRKRVE